MTIIGGVASAVGGIVTLVGSAIATATGVGAPVGVPGIIASWAAIVGGITAIGVGILDIIEASKEIESCDS